MKKYSASRFYEFLALFCLGVAVLGCGKVKDLTKKKDKVAELSPEERLQGRWFGFYTPLDDEGEPFGESRKCQVTFEKDGRFSIAFKDDSNAAAAGNWFEFDSRSLFLTVDESNISKLPTSSSALDTPYDLNGDSLTIKGRGFEMNLRPLSDEQASGSGPNSALSPTEGQWKCVQGNTTTRLGFNEDKTWGAVIENNGSLYLLGDMDLLVDQKKAVLKTTSASIDRAKDAQLEFVWESSAVARLTILTSNDDLGLCSR